MKRNPDGTFCSVSGNVNLRLPKKKNMGWATNKGCRSTLWNREHAGIIEEARLEKFRLEYGPAVDAVGTLLADDDKM